MLGVNASSKGALIQSGSRIFLAPSNTKAMMLDTARISKQQPTQEMEAMSCFFWWVSLVVVPLFCFGIGVSNAGLGFYAFINPCFTVPLFVINFVAVLDLWYSGNLDKFMKGEIVDPICHYIIIAICLQAFCGLVLVSAWIGLMNKKRQLEAEQKERMEKMAKAMEAQMTNLAKAMAKQAQEQKKSEVVAEIKKEIAEIEDVLDAEHKAYYASDEFKAKCDVIFDNADANKNGVIDPDEFQAALAAALDDDMIPVYKTEFFKAFDMDNDQKIERDEFHILMKYMDSHGPAKLKEQSIFKQAYAEPEIKVVCKVIAWPPPKR